jgi:hypothetical protein
MVKLMLWLAVICLLISVLAPVLFFMGAFDAATFRSMLFAAAIGWFVFATAWAVRRDQKSKA